MAPRCGYSRKRMGTMVGATPGRPALLLGLVVGPLLAVLLALAWASPAGAQSDGRSVVAQRYDSDLSVQDGGDVAVRETLQMSFQGGPFTKGERRIPLDRLVGVSGVRVEQTAPQAVAYQSGQGQANTYSVRQVAEGGDRGSVLIEWWFPSTTNQSRTFVISYLAQGAVRYYDGGDQLYWDVTGDERPYPIQESTVSLRLPAGITAPTEDWRTDLYPRRFLRDTAVTTGGVTWRTGRIPDDETFEVRAQWPHGLISGSPPPWQQAADEQDRLAQSRAPFFTFVAGVGALAVALLGGLWLLVTWYTRGRDPAVGKVPPELQDPPSDLPPALVGTVVDEHADAQDVVATVLDLAARGEIAIREVSNASLSGGKHDFELQLLHDRATLDPRLRPHERLVLDSFFTRGPTVRLSELGGWWQYAVPAHRGGAAPGRQIGRPVLRRSGADQAPLPALGDDAGPGRGGAGRRLVRRRPLVRRTDRVALPGPWRAGPRAALPGPADAQADARRGD